MFYKRVVFCAVFCFLRILFCNGQLLTDEEYKTLPTLFTLEKNYEKCKNYCSVHLRLRPVDQNNKSQLWNLIEVTQKSDIYYDHGYLHNVLCMDKKSRKKTFEKLEKKLDEQYLNDGLEAYTDHFWCSSLIPRLGYYEIFVLLFMGTLVFSVIYATSLDWQNSKNEKKEKTPPKNNEMLMAFSIIRNMEKLHHRKKYEFVEGVRTYSMLIIVIFHNIVTFISVYLKNPEFIEELFANSFIRGIFFVSMFIVQVYFVLSAVFLILQILELNEANGKFTFKDTLLLILNRYVRLIGPQLILLMFHVSNFPLFTVGGFLKEYVEREYITGHNYWYLALFFIHNNFGLSAMSVQMSWYVAVDFQLYIISTILIYVGLKCKLNFYKLLSFLMLLCVFVNGLWNYSQGFPVVHPISPKSYTVVNHLRSSQYFSLYISTYSNAATYLIGLMIGLFAYNYRDKGYFTSFINYLIMFVGVLLPIIPVFLAQYEYEPILTAILSAILKPVYSLGFGCLVLGLIFEKDTFIHKFYEWRPIVFFGNFTYSTYMFHFAPVLGKVALFPQPLYLNAPIMLASMIWDIFIAYVTGIIGYFTIEMPILNFQKRFVPTVKKQIKTEKKPVK